MSMETKAVTLDLKALAEDGTIEGYGATFGNVDRGSDKIMPGAFTKGIAAALKAKRSIKMLWYHDATQPIGVWDEATEDARGLRVKGRLILSVARAREVYDLLKAGALDSLSIGYRTVKEAYDGDIRILTEVDLYEISPVTFPMNDKAVITKIKADGMDEITERLAAGERLTERQFEKLAKGLGLSNAQAERAARIHLKGQGEPAEAASKAAAELRKLIS